VVDSTLYVIGYLKSSFGFADYEKCILENAMEMNLFLRGMGDIYARYSKAEPH
jgi:hypothetical protein